MKKLTTLLSLVLVMVLAFGYFGAPQAKAEEDLSGTLRYAYWDTNQDPWLQQAIEAFNEVYPNVEIVTEPTAWTTYWTKLENAATGGSIADVVWINGPNITKYAQGGILKPLTGLIEDTSVYPEGLINMYTVDGELMAIPKDFDTVAVWYNKTLFDEAGVEYPTDDWTWDDLVEKAQALTKEDGSVYGLAIQNTNQAGFYNVVFGNGGYVVSEDKKESGWDKPEAQKAIQDLVDLIEMGVSPSQASLEETLSDAQFTAGRVAMNFAGSWALPVYADSDIADQIDVVEMPTMENGKATVIHGVGHAINANTEVPELAEAFVKFLSGQESMTISAETGAAIPSYEGMADAWKNNYPEWNLQAYLTAASEYSYAYPVSAATAEWLDAEANWMNQIYGQQVSVEEGLNALAEEMNAVLAREGQ